MFCKYCGKEVADNAMFCDKCGQPLQAAPVQASVEEVAAVEEVAVAPVEEVAAAEPVAEEPIEQAAEEVAPAEEAVEFWEEQAEAVFVEPQAPKKSKKKLLGILIPVVAVVAAVAVLFSLFSGPIIGFFVETFGSDAAYFRHVEEKALYSVTDDISEAYGTFLEGFQGDVATKTSLKLNMGDKVISFLEDVLNQETNTTMNLDWLNTIALDMNVNVKDNIEQVLAAVKIGDKTLADASVIVNMDEGEVFVGILSLSDKYLKGDLSAQADTIAMEIYQDPAFKKMLPSERELNKLLDKYIEIAFANIDEDHVKASKDTVKIAGINQKLTALEVEITQEDIVNIAKAVLKEAKDDKQIKGYIEEFSNYFEKKDLIDDADDVCDAYVDGIKYALDELRDTDADDETLFTLIDYVNGSHEVVGRKLEVDGDEIVYYATVRDGAKLAFELQCGPLSITGEGTEKRDVINATYAVEYDSDKIGDIVLTDFKAVDDTVNGKISIEPSAQLLNNMGLDSAVSSVLSLADPRLELVFEGKKGFTKVDCNLVSGTEVFFGFTISGEEVKATTVNLPSSENVYEEDEVSEWVASFEYDDLLNVLKGLGLPSELMDLLEGEM